MTGYGAKEFTLMATDYSLSIKCLNNTKGLDISLKLPRNLSSLEPLVRKLISKALIRGKVSFSVTESTVNANLDINKNKLKDYLNTLSVISPDSSAGDLLNAAVSMPNVVVSDSFKLSRKDGLLFLSFIEETLDQVCQFRNTEGKKLEKEVRSYITAIKKINKTLPVLELKRNSKKKSELMKKISSVNDHLSFDPSRLESEMIYYFEKNDLTEELVRLNLHCDFFLEVISDGLVMGKKLNFISQEILREINTIGSKSNDFQIQKKVILMKEEIEKVKEQAQNIL